MIGKAPHRPDPCDFWGTKKLLGHVSNVEGHMLNNNLNTNNSTFSPTILISLSALSCALAYFDSQHE